jgi:hypothetical protein
MNHLSLEGVRKAFRTKPNTKLARWYLQSLLRSRAADKINDNEVYDGIAEIKAWMNKERIQI